MTTKSDNKRTYHVQALDRVFSILHCFSLRTPELSLGEICQAAGLPKPTAFRLLSVLETERFVERTSAGKYQVGIKAFELGSIFLEHLSVEHIARPVMERLTERYNMASNLAILDNGQVVYVAATDPIGPMRYSPIVGYRHYVHCSALGKALIAQLPDKEIHAILKARGMPALSPHTITEPKRLLAELQIVRQQGFAMDNQEGAVGVCCLAVPIHNHLGQVAAALSISGISQYFDADSTPRMARQLREGATEISRHLGWRGADARS